MSVRVIRLNRLFNHPAVKARRARDGKPAVKARPARKGVLDIGKSNFYKNIVLSDPTKPCIPGTDIRRLPVIPLGKKAVGASEEEVERIVDELARRRFEGLQCKRDDVKLIEQTA